MRVIGVCLLALLSLGALSACETDRSTGGGGVRVVGTVDSGVPRADGGLRIDGSEDRDGSAPLDGDMQNEDGSMEGPDGGDAGPPGGDAGPGADGGPFNDAGCLTFQGASQFCGFSSDEQVCNFSVMCESSSSLSQCKINCEMGTTIMCYTLEDLACVANAINAIDCAAFRNCGWIF